MSDRSKFIIIMWSVALGLSIGVFCFCLFVPMVQRPLHYVASWSEACISSGIIIALMGALYVVAHFGAFDMLAYGVRDVIWHMNPAQDKQKKYKDYTDYVEKRREKNRLHGPYFWPFLAFAGAFLLAGIILKLVASAVAG